MGDVRRQLFGEEIALCQIFRNFKKFLLRYFSHVWAFLKHYGTSENFHGAMIVFETNTFIYTDAMKTANYDIQAN